MFIDVFFLLQMARLNHIVLGILILQIHVYAAPKDVSKLEEIAKVEQAAPLSEQSDSKVEQTDPKLDSEPKEVESDSNSTETQRHKRWYNPYSYGFPPFNPFINPGYNKRDEGTNTGYYGEDPLALIHRRVQEIAHFVRQPQQQPLPPQAQIPIFYPVLFVHPGDCDCNNENQTPSTPEPDTAVTPADNNNDGNSTDGTTPTVASRWPQMEDNRQNWGLVVNDSDSEEGIDFSRPISFDPIRLNRPTMRPAPPVEHGTVQGMVDSQNQPQSEAPSAQSPLPTRPPPPTTRQPTQSFNRPPSSQPPRRPASGLAPPSPCDSAILACCHQPQVVYDCFAIQGCPDLTGYGSPCEPSQILRVIERFQMYYGQRFN